MLYSMYSRHKKNLAARFAPHKQKRQVGDAYISDLSFPSKLREAFPHLLVIELALLRLLQHIHRFRDGGVPLIPTNLLPVLPLLQPVIGAVILHLGRGAVGFALGLLAVSAHLPAGALCLTGSNVAAVAGVISCRQQKIPPAVMAAARRVARSQSPAVSKSLAGIPSKLTQLSIQSRVVPSMSLTIERSSFKSALKSEDFPAFVFPARTIFAPS